MVHFIKIWRILLRWVVKKFPEWWYCSVMAEHDGNSCVIACKVGPLLACACTRANTVTHRSIDPATFESTSRVRQSHSIWYPLWLRNVSPWGPLSESGTARSHSELDPECTVVGRQEGWCVIVMQKPLSLPLVAPLPPNFIAQHLQNLHVDMTCNIL
jgi:hypothetical protein